MQNQRKMEITVGILVAGGLAALILLAMQVSNLSAFSDDEGHILTAKFSNIGGLKSRAVVRMAGVKIGRITAVKLDPQDHQAIISLNISKKYPLPIDSIASIYTSGLLGEQYVAIKPGKDKNLLTNGGVIKLTESAVVMEKMLGDFFSLSSVRGFDQADSYPLTAKFSNIGTLKINSAVTLGGVTVGRVAAVSLDPKGFDAVVVLAIKNNVQLPMDTSATVYSASLLGGQYIGLEPGAEETYLKAGEEIEITQPAMILEKLIGEFLFNSAAGDKP